MIDATDGRLARNADDSDRELLDAYDEANRHVSTIGKGSLAEALHSTVTAIEARQDARELAAA